MKNLHLSTEQIGSLWSSDTTPSDTIITCCCLDSTTQTIYVLTSNNDYIVYNASTKHVINTISLLSTDTQADPSKYNTSDGLLLNNDTIINSTYLPELESVVLCSKHGNILSITNDHIIDNVGYMLDGISCVEWSNDQELCCIITNSGKLMYMTNQYDFMYEYELDDTKTQKHIGSTCSWRGDGQYIVINSLFTTTNSNQLQRILRVYNRSAELTSSSAIYAASHNTLSDGISNVISWKPSGSVIVTTQRNTIDVNKQLIKHQVIMFERNGLRHGEFNLPQLNTSQNTQSDTVQSVSDNGNDIQRHDEHKHGENDDTIDLNDFATVQAQWNTTVQSNISDANIYILSLQWNCDSDILSVQYQLSDQSDIYISFYTQSNWHWYLKQHMSLGRAGGRLLWDNESGNRCSILYHSTGEIRCLQVIWDVDVSSEIDRITSVVDSTNLLITPLGRIIVPPPMSHITVPYKLPIKQVFYPECKSFNNQLYNKLAKTNTYTPVPAAVLLYDDTLLFYNDIMQYQTRQPIQIKLCNNTSKLKHIRHLSWLANLINNDIHCVVLINADVTGDHIVEVHITGHNSNVEVIDMYSTPVPQHSTVLRTHPHCKSRSVYIQLINGEIYTYQPVYWQHESTHDSTPLLLHTYTLPVPCAYFSYIELANEYHFIGRTVHNKLYIDDTLISPQCSSYTITHPNYIMFTIAGQQNALFFISRSLSLHDNLDPGVRSDITSVRLMERGCSIICAVPDIQQPRIITQMPRGNLEVVYPRILSLLSINNSLNRYKYKIAFITARTNRIDFNILVDHNKPQFIQHIHQFVTDIDNVDYLNLFITSLNNDDITQTEFQHYKSMNQSMDMNITNIMDPNKLLQQSIEQDTLIAGLKANNESTDHKPLHNNNKGIDRRTVFNQKLKEQAAIQYEQQNHTTDNDNTSKVNTVCQLLRDAMISINYDRYILPILTTYVKQEPADYITALQLIQKLRSNEHHAQSNTKLFKLNKNKPVNHQSSQSATPTTTSHDALKYIIFLSDIYSLYTTALSLYDFDLVMLVVQYSSYDPKEILSILGGFVQYSATPYYQRYCIDMHLKHWHSAVHNLLCSVVIDESIDSEQSFNTAIQLIQQHNLYIESMKQLQSYQSINHTVQHYYNRVLSAFAEHLFTQSQYNHAAIAYITANDLTNALKCYKSALNTDQCLSLAVQLHMNINEQQQLIYEIVDTLQSVRPVEAAQLLVHHCDDTDRAIEILCKSEQWSTACSICYTQQRDDLIETHIIPEIDLAYNRRMTQLDQLHSHYKYCVTRLRLIRRVKLLFPPNEHEYELLGVDERDDDLQSIITGIHNNNDLASSIVSSSASTASSVFSVVSSTASMVGLTADEKRIKKAQQRKLRKNKHVKRIKEGSIHEESYLINELMLTTPDQKFKLLIQSLINILIQFNRISHAALLQNKFHEFIQYIQWQESTPMPVLHNATTEQIDALNKRWNWPASSYPTPQLPYQSNIDNTSHILPFLFNDTIQQSTIPSINGISSKQIDELLSTVETDIETPNDITESKDDNGSSSNKPAKKGNVELEYE